MLFRSPVDADYGALHEQGQVERQLRNVAAGKAYHEEPRAPSRGAQRRLGARATDRIVDDVDALALRQALDPRAQVFPYIVDRLVCAMRAADGEFLRAGSRFR